MLTLTITPNIIFFIYNRNPDTTLGREVKLNLFFFAKKNISIFFLKGVTIRSKLLFISNVEVKY